MIELFDLWIKLKIFTDFIIPFAMISVMLLVIILWLILYYLDSTKQKRKIELLKRNGFERFLKDVPSYGNGAFYAWRKERIIFDERDLKHMTYKQLKRKIKGSIINGKK